MPALELWSGTTPRSAAPRSTASKTAAKEGQGTGSAPGSIRAASSPNAPGSPAYATFTSPSGRWIGTDHPDLPVRPRLLERA